MCLMTSRAPHVSMSNRRERLSIEVSCDDHMDATLILSEANGFRLYMSGDAISMDIAALESLGITSIINATVSSPNFFESHKKISYLRLSLKDNTDEKLDTCIDESWDFIETARKMGRAVLCHCEKGMSRSASIVLAYVMRHMEMSLVDSLELLKSRRPQTSPNSGFMEQLLEYEVSLFEERSPSLSIAQYRHDRFSSAAELRGGA